jgi:hypothetical protein
MGGRSPQPTGSHRIGDDPLVGSGFADPVPLGKGDKPPVKPELKGWPRTITWKDFTDVENKPAGAGDENAQIDSQVEQPADVAVVREGDSFRVTGYVAKQKIFKENSWVVTSAKSAELLDHEQGHYDITGLIGRDMIADIGAARASSPADLGREVKRIIAEANALGEKLTKAYDHKGTGGTDHGRDRAAQKRWNDHLAGCRDKGTRLTAAPS